MVAAVVGGALEQSPGRLYRSSVDEKDEAKCRIIRSGTTHKPTRYPAAESSVRRVGVTRYVQGMIWTGAKYASAQVPRPNRPHTPPQGFDKCWSDSNAGERRISQ